MDKMCRYHTKAKKELGKIPRALFPLANLLLVPPTGALKRSFRFSLPGHREGKRRAKTRQGTKLRIIQRKSKHNSFPKFALKYPLSCSFISLLLYMCSCWSSCLGNFLFSCWIHIYPSNPKLKRSFKDTSLISSNQGCSFSPVNTKSFALLLPCSLKSTLSTYIHLLLSYRK